MSRLPQPSQHVGPVSLCFGILLQERSPLSKHAKRQQPYQQRQLVPCREVQGQRYRGLPYQRRHGRHRFDRDGLEPGHQSVQYVGLGPMVRSAKGRSLAERVDSISHAWIYPSIGRSPEQRQRGLGRLASLYEGMLDRQMTNNLIDIGQQRPFHHSRNRRLMVDDKVYIA